MSDIEPATPRGTVAKKAAKSASSGRSVSKSAAAGRYIADRAAARKPVAGAFPTLKSYKREKVIVERIVEVPAEKPRRKRSREENEKLVAAAKALVAELREDQKTLPHGI